jgi:hypothetical protein
LSDPSSAEGSGQRAADHPARLRIDHLVYAAPDLDAGVAEIERLLGVRPAAGGRHPHWGTRNALLSLGPRSYLEVVGPDPEAPAPARGRLFGVETLDCPCLVTWALRCEAIEEVAARAGAALVGSVETGCREAPDGTLLTWNLTDPYAMPLGGTVPFLIAWGDTPHPAAAAPSAGTLAGLRIEHPDPAEVRAALSVLGVTLPVARGPRPRLVATIRSPHGGPPETIELARGSGEPSIPRTGHW